MNKRTVLVVVLALAVILIAVFFLLRPKRYQATFTPMGDIPFTVIVDGRNMLQFDDDFEAVEEGTAHLVGVFNRHDPASELSRMNELAFLDPFAASPAMREALALSRRWVEASGGAFDPSVEPLIALWEEAGRAGELPTAAAIAAEREHVGFLHVVTLEEGQVRYTVPGAALDFGAIAKGLIVDHAASALRDRGVERAILEVGGDAIAFGPGSFTFGIQDPTDRTKLLGTVAVEGGAVVTSGNYERFTEIDGKRYSHIIDPRTGRPEENGLVSVTIVGGRAAAADAIATAVMVLGREAGAAFLAGLDDVAAVLVESTPEGFVVWVSESLGARLTLDPPWDADRRPL